MQKSWGARAGLVETTISNVNEAIVANPCSLSAIFFSQSPLSKYIEEAVTDVLMLLCTLEWIFIIVLTACSALLSCSYMYGRSIDNIITNASYVSVMSHAAQRQWQRCGIEYIFNIKNTAHISPSWIYYASMFSIAKVDDLLMDRLMKPSCSISYQIHTFPSAYAAYIGI